MQRSASVIARYPIWRRCEDSKFIVTAAATLSSDHGKNKDFVSYFYADPRHACRRRTGNDADCSAKCKVILCCTLQLHVHTCPVLSRLAYNKTSENLVYKRADDFFDRYWHVPCTSTEITCTCCKLTQSAQYGHFLRSVDAFAKSIWKRVVLPTETSSSARH